jgi:hypothetical protein
MSEHAASHLAPRAALHTAPPHTAPPHTCGARGGARGRCPASHLAASDAIAASAAVAAASSCP